MLMLHYSKVDLRAKSFSWRLDKSVEIDPVALDALYETEQYIMTSIIKMDGIVRANTGKT